jgi:gamma-glutamyltranspeptidase / glutathione hydrolase
MRLGRIFTVLLILFSSVGHTAPVEGHKIMISAPNHYAVEVGRKIAQRGGNVVDVAVAVGLSLSVTAPFYAALGGGGFALVKMKDEVQALDFRETAPKATHKDYYLALPTGSSQNGPHAVATPGFPAGLFELHQKFGKMKWELLFTDAIDMADKGFAVTGGWVNTTNKEKERFNKTGQKVFLNKELKPYRPGEVLKQPALAKALVQFQRQKLKGFYDGPVAKDIVDTVVAGGGSLSLEDLKNYKVRWLKPITTDYEGHKVHLMPPPSSGGVVILSALNMIEKLDVKSKPLFSADEFHWLAEIESRAFRGRALLGDPDFHKNPVSFLTSSGYLEEMRKSIKPKRSVALKPLVEGDIQESRETTHFSVMDSDGQAIALTVTLNGSYGSGVVSDKFGIALNNEMDDFTTKPGEPNMYGLVQGPGNNIEAGKRPLSSMSPTLVEKNGKVVMTLGAPGGPRIITGVLQALYRIIGRGMDVDSAVQAPRVHHQFLPNTLYIDRQRFSPEIVQELSNRGHKVEESWMAKVYVVRLRPDGILEAAFDSRGEGDAGGI